MAVEEEVSPVLLGGGLARLQMPSDGIHSLSASGHLSLSLSLSFLHGPQAGEGIIDGRPSLMPLREDQEEILT